MGYHIKMEEVLEIQNSIFVQIEEWGNQLAQVQNALEQVAMTTAVQGMTGNSVRNYVAEVHIPLVGSLQQMLFNFQVQYALYANGYYEVDGSNEAEIAQEVLENQQTDLNREQSDFATLAESVTSVLKSVNDIVSISNPRKTTISEAYETLLEKVVTLNTEVGEYEASHENDTETIESIMSSIEAIISARSGAGVTVPTRYQSGSVLQMPEYLKLGNTLQNSNIFVNMSMSQYEEAIEKYGQRWNDKCAEERKEEGFWTALGGVMAVIAGAALIVATAGMATPIVVGAFAVGSTSMLYGLSNTAEGANSVYLGFKGDGTTLAKNPIRDTFFANNPELYYTIGNTSTLISSLAIPIGGVGNTALKAGTSPLRAMLVEGGKIGISSVAGDMTSQYIYKETGNRTLSMISGMGAGGLTYGGLAKMDSIANISGIHGKTNIQNLRERENIGNKQNSEIVGEGASGADFDNIITDGSHITKVGNKKILKPNITYQDSNGYIYKTDELGRITSASGELKLGTGKRNPYAQRTVGGEDRLLGDDGGHIFGNQFNGSGDIDNLLPQGSVINRAKGEYYNLEKEWADAIKDGAVVKADVMPVFDGISKRPKEFNITYSIDGEEYTKIIKNK